MNWCFSNNTHTHIPADVPTRYHNLFLHNYHTVTGNKERIIIFSGDQKIEHLNADFYGQEIHSSDTNPKHMFEIAERWHQLLPYGIFCTHLGLLARYAKQYKYIRYFVKLNGKTNLIPTEHDDPQSTLLWSVDDVIRLKGDTKTVSIYGVAVTVYLGSIYEELMLEQAAQTIFQAHQHGLLAAIWMYPRGSSIKDEYDGQLIAGAAGVAASLGADIVKIHQPHNDDVHTTLKWLRIIQQAAGTTKVVLSSGPKIPEQELLSRTSSFVHEGTIAGIAIGRNIHQRSTDEAVILLKALSETVYR